MRWALVGAGGDDVGGVGGVMATNHLPAEAEEVPGAARTVGQRDVRGEILVPQGWEGRKLHVLQHRVDAQSEVVAYARRGAERNRVGAREPRRDRGEPRADVDGAIALGGCAHVREVDHALWLLTLAGAPPAGELESLIGRLDEDDR